MSIGSYIHYVMLSKVNYAHSNSAVAQNIAVLIYP